MNVDRSPRGMCVNARLGFKGLSAIVDKKHTSLMQMFSENGNPNLNKISHVLAAVRTQEEVELHISAG